MTDKPQPKTRGYDANKHSSLPYVDKLYKRLLDDLAANTRKSKKATLEDAILSASVDWASANPNGVVNK